MISNSADEGPYRILIEGLESWAAILKAGSLVDDEDDVNYDYTPSGQKYVAMRR